MKECAAYVGGLHKVRRGGGVISERLQGQIGTRARRLNGQSVTVDVHNHMMFEFALRSALGEINIFDTHYAPALRRGGINVIATSVGANSPCTCNMTDNLEIGVFEQIDMLRLEEERSDYLPLCCNVKEIEAECCRVLGENFMRVYREVLGK